MSRKNVLIILSIIAGGVGGYLYYLNIGCLSGTCMITSKPLPSTIYGAMMGGLISGSISDFINKKKSIK